MKGKDILWGNVLLRKKNNFVGENSFLKIASLIYVDSFHFHTSHCNGSWKNSTGAY